jgi:hypothetical protein
LFLNNNASTSTPQVQDAYNVPSQPPPLTSLDSAFQLQEYIALLVKADVHDVHRIVAIPTRRDEESSSSNDDEGAGSSAEEEKAADEHCWIYEQLRSVFDCQSFREEFNP